MHMKILWNIFPQIKCHVYMQTQYWIYHRRLVFDRSTSTYIFHLVFARLTAFFHHPESHWFPSSHSFEPKLVPIKSLFGEEKWTKCSIYFISCLRLLLLIIIFPCIFPTSNFSQVKLRRWIRRRNFYHSRLFFYESIVCISLFIHL